jgi:hypothetical protein
MNRNIINGLAMLGAMLVLLAVLTAANSALAEAATAENTVGVTADELENASLDSAERANREAAQLAARRMADENRQDLDFRLVAPTSILVARGR